MLPTTLMTAALATAMATPPHASLSAQPEPDPSWEEDTTADEVAADTPDEPTSETPAEASDLASEAAETPEPAAVQPASTAEPTHFAPMTIDDIKIPKKNGLGLMITAGALGAVGWGVMGWRISRIQRRCTADSVDYETISEDVATDLLSSGVGCFAARGGNALLWTLQALPNGANWGIAPAAAAARAKYDAAVSVKTGEVDRSPGLFIGTGAALLGLGVAARIAVMVFQVQALNPEKSVISRCVDGEETQADEFFDCYSRDVSIRYAMHQLSSAAVAGGAGLLTYGIVYKRERRKYSEQFGAEPVARLELSMQPRVGFNYTGISANLRF